MVEKRKYFLLGNEFIENYLLNKNHVRRFIYETRFTVCVSWAICDTGASTSIRVVYLDKFISV